MTHRLPLAIGLTLALVARSPLALGSETDAPGAQTLFDEGKKLALEGKCDEATAKFIASNKIQPSVGALLNMGDCAEKQGRSATAWARFVEASSLAKRKNDDRESYARERAAALEPKLSRLTLTTFAQPSTLEVRRDGVTMDAAAFGVAVPVDPGEHVVEARAEGYRPFRTTLTVKGDGAAITFAIPPLEALPRLGTTTAGEASTARGTWSTQKTFAIVLGAFGVASALSGSLLALDARAKFRDAQSTCTDAGCSEGAAHDASDAQRMGRVATVMFVVSGAALASSVLLWVTAAPLAPDLSPHHAGLVFSGRF